MATSSRTSPDVAPRLREAVRALPVSSFALVMATGIVSAAADRFHFPLLSLALLAIATASFAVLLVLHGWRIAVYPGAVVDELSAPRASFGFFAFVAAAAVLGERLDELHQPTVALALLALASFSWALLTYAIPARLMLLRQKAGLSETVGGDWLLWVVGTQSIATVAAMVATHERALQNGMAVVAIWAWSVGVFLYLILMTILMVRLFTVGLDARQLSASYWISMGATAITTLAGARILELPHALPILRLGVPVVGGISLMFWCFGTWWIPLLMVLGIWRHWRGRHPIGYDREFWSLVFPLGMYATASAEFGRAANLGFMVQLGGLDFWLALGAWLAVSIGLLISITRVFTAPRMP